jgi:alpha-beta hydrolase superfamily lysophospholipase
MLAGRDQIIDNDRTRHWFERLGWPGCTLTEYPDAEHTIEFEADPTRFFDDLVGWIERAT